MLTLSREIASRKLYVDTRNVARYNDRYKLIIRTGALILKIKHRGLRSFWQSGRTSGLNAAWINKIDRILFALDQAAAPADMDFPSFRLHPLKGKFAGYHAVDVSGNWRIVFRFEGTDTTDIDLIDYH